VSCDHIYEENANANVGAGTALADMGAGNMRKRMNDGAVP